MSTSECLHQCIANYTNRVPDRSEKSRENKVGEGREEEGGDAIAGPAEQHGARQSSAKLKFIAAVISSRLVGESPVSFALFSAIKARKFTGPPIFARQLACAVAQGELVLTQADQRKIKAHRCGDF